MLSWVGNAPSPFPDLADPKLILGSSAMPIKGTPVPSQRGENMWTSETIS